MTRRVLLVALDGAEPTIVSPLIERGDLPVLRGIVENGCFGSLTSPRPLVRAMTWTTLATGVRAPRHGVCADVEVRADGGGVRPASRMSWRVPALWEHLTAEGMRTATIGWPATGPAASWEAGVVLDDAFCEPLGPGFDAWPLLPDCIAPGELRDEFRDLRVHPGDITAEQLLTFVPDAKLVDQDADARLAQLAVMLARTSTVHAAATHILEARTWDFAAVAYPLMADAMRSFLPFRLPAVHDADARDIAIYGAVVDHAYRLQDAMLGVLLRLAGAGTTVLVVSPHGFASGADRPGPTTAERMGDAVAWHRPQGIVAAMGPGIPSDCLVHGSRLEDIAPTILALFGLHAEGIDGRNLVSLAETSQATRPVHAPAPRAHDADAFFLPDEVGLDEAQRFAVDRAKLVRGVNMAEAHLAAGDYAHAAEHYARVLDARPDDWLAKARLARCRLHLGEFDACRALAGEVVAAEPDLPWGHLLFAAALTMSGATSDADASMARARERGKGLPNVSLRLGTLYLVRHEWKPAEALFREALASMPRAVEAHDGLGCALHAQGRHEEAIAAFRTGLGFTYHSPLTHLHLALALAALGRWDDAERAGQVAKAQDGNVPGFAELSKRIASARTTTSQSSRRL